MTRINQQLSRQQQQTLFMTNVLRSMAYAPIAQQRYATKLAQLQQKWGR